MGSRYVRIGGAAAAGLLVLWEAVAAQTHKVGLYFDEGASVCTAEVRNYAPPVRAYVYAMVPEGTEVNGALIRLALPFGFFVRNETAPHGADLDGALTLENGLNITMPLCPVVRAPVLLLSFDLYQFDLGLEPGARTPGVILQIEGGALLVDSLSFRKPQVKVCSDDPYDPRPELVEAPSVLSTLNCSSDCPCTTPVNKRSWADVKRLFRGR